MPDEAPRERGLPQFDRKFFESDEDFTIIGEGSIGGKAQGLLFMRNTLALRSNAGEFQQVQIAVPTLTVIATDSFDAFMEQNKLWEVALSDLPDHRIALAFQQASLPVTLVGDLHGLIQKVHTPLAVRSSSLLEDAMYRPFAGVYGTKMVPNNQHDVGARFRKLAEAIKFVYASTFFHQAKSYLRATDKTSRDEKMAVIIQEVVGRSHGDRFYPDVSGVGRSYNFYPTGHGRPQDGVVSLALGLGKTIVDGEASWSYSPAFPRIFPPYNSMKDLLRQTQTRFWAVNMGKPPEYDPIRETEYLVQPGLTEAEEDEVLRPLVSTYDSQGDRLSLNFDALGPRILTFAPLLSLEIVPLNPVLMAMLSVCKETIGADVEIEFALTLSGTTPPTARFGFLQVRPMAVSNQLVSIAQEHLRQPGVLAASERALGNGIVETIQDVVYVKPESFDTSQTQTMACQLDAINRTLLAAGRPYLLIGFGRWGTSDPWLGIPVKWGQISGAKVIVEASLPDVNPDPSQGSHFFHNVTSFQVLYMSIPHSGEHRIDWEWLGRQACVSDTQFVRHVRLERPLRIKVDGRSGRGLIVHEESSA